MPGSMRGLQGQAQGRGGAWAQYTATPAGNRRPLCKREREPARVRGSTARPPGPGATSAWCPVGVEGSLCTVRPMPFTNS